MPLLILNKRPIIRSILREPILNDLILCCIVGILADPPRKLGMVGINTRINHCNGHTTSGIAVPYRAHIQIVKIGLPAVIGITNRILRTNRQSPAGLILRLNNIADTCTIVCRELLNVRAVLAVGIHISDGYALRKRQSCIFAVRRDP